LKKDKTTAVTATPQTDGISRTTSYSYTRIIDGMELKVTVHIPDNVPRRQEKTNQLYDLLKPEPISAASIESV